jgi:predicted dehydrogenase
MNKLKCAVVGVGYLGRFHAQKFNELPTSELIAVCDLNPDTVDAVANELNVPSIYDYTELFDKVHAVSIAATTNQHYLIAKDFLNHGIHVLIEKPITETVAQANELIDIATKNNAIIQVGHLERFNSARIALNDFLDRPQFIESQRLAPFNPRGTDVNVVLDLMIHDIDIIQSIIESPIKQINAQGAPVLSKFIDIANAHLTFENGCVANVTASRVSFKRERKTRIFQPNSYISIDYQDKKLAVFNKGNGEMFPGIPDIVKHESTFEKSDALLEEIKSFVHCVTHNTKPLVTGLDGLNALDVATKITQTIKNNISMIPA